MKTKFTLLLISLLSLLSLGAFAQVNPFQLGRASNVYSVIRTGQNSITADDSSGLITFIHRQDVTIYGGGSTASGMLRYDISIDGGTTFTNDIGILNQVYTYPARYPQICKFNLSGTANPLLFKYVWAAPTVDVSADWDGFVAGSGTANTSTAISSEYYEQIGENSLLPSSLCEGLPGDFWMVDFDYNGTIVGDSLRIYKGTFNSGTSNVDWGKHNSLFMTYSTSFDGTSYKISPSISFSPDGNTGWIGYLGDLIGGADSSYNPIFMKSTDGGATWSSAVEIDLRNIPYVGDSTSLSKELQSLWTDTFGAPLSTGRPTCAYECDLTVDANGNPHMFLTVGSASISSNPLPNYSIYAALTKLAIDISSDDGGTTWKATKIAPIYTFRGTFGSANTISMDNFSQISRTENGEYIFYSWADSDTTILGFGTSSNDAPNLRIAGLRISDGYQTCPKWITNGDLMWDGKALFPTMAPTVLTDDGSSADYKLPIVMVEMITNDALSPCQYYYFGNDATFLETDFLAHGNDLNLDYCTISCTSNPSAEYSSSQNGLTVDFSDASTITGNATYLWDFGDGNTSSLQNPTYVYIASGAYTACLTVTDYCGTDSVCHLVNVTNTGIQEAGKEFIKVYPNPGDGYYNVELLGFENEELNIAISDITGKTVYQENKNNSEFVLNLSFLEKGIYVLKVNGITRSVSTRLIIM
ncbi:MAG: T9SS type A sorting domain-containing protein [Bacteroidales bacterium]|nr:T9SS type A sorting domain-containing protein [Bacteroidales bacterium]